MVHISLHPRQQTHADNVAYPLEQRKTNEVDRYLQNLTSLLIHLRTLQACLEQHESQYGDSHQDRDEKIHSSTQKECPDDTQRGACAAYNQPV